MVFNSIAFIVFFAIVSLLMMASNLGFVKKLLGKHLFFYRHIVLLIASYVFYGWWDWRFAFLMLALSFIAWLCSLKYEQTRKKIYVYVAVVAPLVALGFFKYFNFFVGSFTSLFGIENAGVLNIILPVGISFYTFQSLSYSIDVIRGTIDAEKSFIKLALYIAFFPQLVAGPIVKAKDFIHQLYEDRNISLRNFEQGIWRFAFGLFKKIVIADNLSVCVDAVFENPERYHALGLIFAVVAYSIQIYCDFSGYSDMAIGTAKALGYDLMHNFNLPYVSKNVTEFWKRWHISLSTWLMEYLYFPLGGNRKGVVRTYINLFLTMLIGGLWHGAAWTFVVWGALHGVALCVHKLWMKLRGHDKNYKGTPIGNAIATVATYLFVIFCLIFFRASDFATAGAVIKGIFTWQSGIMYISSWTVFSIIIVGACTLIAVIRSSKKKIAIEGFYPSLSLNSVLGLTVLLVILGLAMGLAYTGSNPFIYFQF